MTPPQAKQRLGDILIAKKLLSPEELEAALKDQKVKGGFLGQILINKGVVSPVDIDRALEEMSSDVRERMEFGRTLVAKKIITDVQLTQAVDRQRATNQNLEDLVVELGFATADQIAELLSQQVGLSFVHLKDYELKQDLLLLIPENFIRNYHIIPIAQENDMLTVAMSDPLNLNIVDQIRLITGYRINPVVATKKDILEFIDKYFSWQMRMKQMLADIRLDKVSDDTAIARIVDTIIHAAIDARASDIHLEPQFPEMRVRFRVDGILHDISNIPKTIEAPLVSRVKILADMDITEHRRPQDGHLTMKFKDNEYDLRVASTSTVTGEKLVLRILDKSGMLLGLEELGIDEKDKKILTSLVARPYGIILVTGPTGSGKTTTLYAILSQMDTLRENIITIEDPVEYRLTGISQIQVNPAASITFATGLRSILRQDPNIIMVGEIRDTETASIAIHAALTGHLVFSTLHTNDAPSAVTRLIDMGIEPFLISSSLIGVVAQRLVRRVCPTCHETYVPDAETLKELGLKDDHKQYHFSRGKGCRDCLGSGYRGRTGLYEVMGVSERMEELILKRESANKVKALAIEEGMTTLREAAIQKVIKGASTPQEVKRIIFSSGD
jgi:type IV pilus assembly protein PilB